MVVVIELGVEHDRGLRPQARQRAVRLVGLGDHEPSPADAGVGAELRHVAADQERRLLAALGEHVRDQRGRARLAVSPRDADAVARRHDVGQHVGAVAHPQAPAARSYELGLVLGDGARDDHLHVAVQVRRIVAHAHVDALGAQLLDRRRRSDRIPRPCGPCPCRTRAMPDMPAPPTPMRCSSALTGDPAPGAGARARPPPRRRAARGCSMPSRMPASRPGAARSSATRVRSSVAVERGVLDDHRAAGRGEVLGVRALMVARGMGIGYEQRGQAGRCELPDGAACATHAEVGGRQHRPEAVGRLDHAIALGRSGHGLDDARVIAGARDVQDDAVLEAARPVGGDAGVVDAPRTGQRPEHGQHEGVLRASRARRAPRRAWSRSRRGRQAARRPRSAAAPCPAAR